LLAKLQINNHRHRGKRKQHCHLRQESIAVPSSMVAWWYDSCRVVAADEIELAALLSWYNA